MTDEQLDELVAATATVTDGALADLPLQVAAAELCEEIMSTSIIELPTEQHPASPTHRGRRWAIAAAATVLLAALGLTVISLGGGADPAWAEPLIEFAESSPQLLLDDGGWEVSRADQYGEGEGEMTFVDGDRRADLFWRAGSFEDWAADRAAGAAHVETGDVLGHPAQISQYADSDDHTALWREDGRTIEFRSTAEDFDEFVGLLGELRVVDIDTWLSAMPESVIQSTNRAAVVEEMLAGVPIPPGFDTAALTASDGFNDRYQLGAQVTGAVGCAWAEQWVTATEAGDEAAARQAAEAMATSHDWAILDEMGAEGAWPQIFGMVADAVVGNGETVDGVPVADFYPAALGCE